jgi:hypothetical protein
MPRTSRPDSIIDEPQAKSDTTNTNVSNEIASQGTQRQYGNLPPFSLMLFEQREFVIIKAFTPTWNQIYQNSN